MLIRRQPLTDHKQSAKAIYPIARENEEIRKGKSLQQSIGIFNKRSDPMALPSPIVGCGFRIELSTVLNVILWVIRKEIKHPYKFQERSTEAPTKNHGKCSITTQTFRSPLHSLSLFERCHWVTALTWYTLHRSGIIAFQMIDFVIKCNLYIFINWLSVLLCAMLHELPFWLG